MTLVSLCISLCLCCCWEGDIYSITITVMILLVGTLPAILALYALCFLSKIGLPKENFSVVLAMTGLLHWISIIGT